jgi:hypothetical protein
MKLITPLVLSVLLIASFSSRGQTNSDDLTGAQKLRLARAIYDQGRLHELPAMLENAIKSGGRNAFTQSEKIEALQILVLSYIYLEEPKKADEKMIELLKSDHFFELTGSEPIEFQNLYKKFRKYPIFKLGVRFGVNQTQVNTIKNYYVLGESEGKGTYSTNLSLQYGLSFEKAILKQQLFIVPELFLSTTVFNYKNTSIYHTDPSVDPDNIPAPASVNQQITQQRIQLNALAQYVIGNNESLNRKLTPYVFLGPSIAYLSSSSFTGEHALESKDNIKGETIDNTKRYNPINVALIAGGGVRLKIGGLYISGDLRYQYGFFNIVNDKNRYSEDTLEMQKLIRQYAYVDNDFSINQIVFNIGLTYPIFSPKKLIK